MNIAVEQDVTPVIDQRDSTRWSQITVRGELEEGLRDHWDTFIFRVKLDFSNVHIYHTDGYIPRKPCLFKAVPSQGIYKYLLL